MKSFPLVWIWISAGLFAISHSALAEIELMAQMGGACNDVVVQGDYVYITEGPNLKVLDWTDPARPELLGQVRLPDLIIELAVSGNLLFAANGEMGVQVVDVSDPANPRISGSIPLQGNTYSIAAQGNMAYALGVYADLVSHNVKKYVNIIGAASPDAPMLLGSVEMEFDAIDIEVENGMALVAGDLSSSLIQIIDVSNPNTPIKKGSLAFDGSFTGSIAAEGNMAFIPCQHRVGEFMEMTRTLAIVDVSDPAAPILRKLFDIERGNWGRIADIAVEQGKAWLSGQGTGLRIIDVSNPDNPVIAGTYDGPMPARFSVAVAEHRVYLAQGVRCELLDGANMAQISSLGTYETPYFCRLIEGSDGVNSGIELFNGQLYIQAASFRDTYRLGLAALDVSQPDEPKTIWMNRWQSTNQSGSHFILSGSLVYFDTRNDLSIYNISNPAEPQLLGTSASLGEFVKVGNFLCSRFRVLEVTNPGFPLDRGYFHAPITNPSITILSNPPAASGPVEAQGSVNLENLVVIAGNDREDYYKGRMEIFDVISNPDAPVPIGNLTLPNPVLDVASSNGRTYAVCRKLTNQGVETGGVLYVIDTSDPASPVRRGFYDLPEGASAVWARDDLAVVSDSEQGIVMIDVANPSAPVFKDSYPLGGRKSMIIDESYLYVYREDGLYILRYSEPKNEAWGWEIYN